MTTYTRYHFTKDTKVVILTGAGISAESGLRTFRDNDGLWEEYRIEDVCTPMAFKRNPVLVWQFYKLRYHQLSNVIPNKGHEALVSLEQYLGDNFTLITQNVDQLHQKAGSKRVIEMHGRLTMGFCTRCHAEFNLVDVDLSKDIPICSQCGGVLRPDIVWFGEIPYQMELIEDKLVNADYFLVIGSSGVVYPAAGFLQIAKQLNIPTIGVNLDAPDNVQQIDEFHQGKSGEILPKLVNLWIK